MAAQAQKTANATPDRRGKVCVDLIVRTALVILCLQKKL
jgi:hypothetical protein